MADRILANPHQEPAVDPQSAEFRDLIREQARLDEEERRKEDERREFERKKPKVAKFAQDATIPTQLQSPIPHHIYEKILKFDYIPLYFFTAEATNDTFDSYSNSFEDTYQICKADGALTLRPANAPSTKKVIPDEHLSWLQFTQAYPRYMTHLAKTGQHREHVDALGKFFLAVAHHPILVTDQGPEILILYQARVRKNWFDSIKAPAHLEELSYNIAILNEDLLTSIEREAGRKIRERNDREVRIFPCQTLPEYELILFLTKTCHASPLTHPAHATRSFRLPLLTTIRSCSRPPVSSSRS
ncbi:hypothetical protein NLI96_g3579 [Meripilus lineatus]|uniref:Uncharacterized protein n=1 Tax=Meripilus lineatus TaxID=2056292 RepID=A0AAD5YIY5_9APHY|nr:hypothetical protein NLI96_g3579 [Physisporinus lineatus]